MHGTMIIEDKYNFDKHYCDDVQIYIPAIKTRDEITTNYIVHCSKKDNLKNI